MFVSVCSTTTLLLGPKHKGSIMMEVMSLKRDERWNYVLLCV